MDPTGQLQVYLALVGQCHSVEARVYCQWLFPGLESVILAALSYAHGVDYDGQILRFFHRYWDDECDCYWSFGTR